MSNYKNYVKSLTEVIKLIDEDSIYGENGAISIFKQHLSEVASIGRFKEATWYLSWREKVYEFGTKFKNKDAIDFLNAIKEAKQGLELDSQEVLDFYYSEIYFNRFPDETFFDKIELLVKTYPNNPEFRHTLGHFHKRKKDFEKAITEYSFAIDIDKKFFHFKSSLFECYMEYFEELVDKSEYEKGLKITNELIANKKFWNEGMLHNYMIGVKERFKDYILLNEKIKNAEKSIKETVQKNQFRVIEILGFFTAIIAFIFSTISIGKSFSFEEAIIFNISLGITLLVFVVLISLFFSPSEFRINDVRIITLIVLILSLILIVTKFGIPIWIN